MNKFSANCQLQLSSTFTIILLKFYWNLGWGYDKENGSRSRILKEIHVPILSTFLCNDLLHYQGRLHPQSMMCAGYNSGGIDACQVCVWSLDKKKKINK